MPAAVVSSAAQIGSALIGKSAADKASKGQEKAAERVANMQFDLLNRSTGYLSPYSSFGGGALPMLGGLLGYGQFPGATGSVGYPMAGGGSGFAPVLRDGTPTNGPDWTAYLQANPDVLAEYNRILPTVAA